MSKTGSMTRWGYDEISKTGIEITAEIEQQFYPIENGNTYRWGDYEVSV